MSVITFIYVFFLPLYHHTRHAYEIIWIQPAVFCLNLNVVNTVFVILWVIPVVEQNLLAVPKNLCSSQLNMAWCQVVRFIRLIQTNKGKTLYTCKYLNTNVAVLSIA